MIVNSKGIGDIQETIDSMRGWTPMDWVITVGGAYLLYALLFTTTHHYGIASSKLGRMSSNRRKRQALAEQLESL